MTTLRDSMAIAWNQGRTAGVYAAARDAAGLPPDRNPYRDAEPPPLPDLPDPDRLREQAAERDRPATTGDRIPLYPWSDGTRSPKDPTYGQTSHRIQWHVEQVYAGTKMTVAERCIHEINVRDALASGMMIDALLQPLPDEAWGDA
jgi:hypothetical protein